MANFKSFKDIHDYNRKLHEDDWNNGQHFVFKLKNKAESDGGVFNNAATLKVAHSQPGENHTVKFEDKLDGTSKDLGGMKMEVKATNDGKIAFDNQLTGLFKDVEGFENSAVHTSGKISAKGGFDWALGFSHDGKDHKFQIKADVKKDPNFHTETVWRPCQWFVVAEKARFDTTFKNTDFELASTIAFPGAAGLQSGQVLSGVHNGGKSFSNLKASGNLIHASGANTAGAQFDIDLSNNAIKSQVALQNQQADHTWKLMAHSSGMARALLQWQLHKCCKANINTSVDLGEVASGKMAPFPWGFGFEVKY